MAQKLILSSNRTIVGLKPNQTLSVGAKLNCSNRTIVGLKRAFLLQDEWVIALQQSHHCGIETMHCLWMTLRRFIAAIAPLWD